MIFPEPVNSIASAITLIDYAVRFLQFLSPQVKSALQETQIKLSNTDSNLSSNIAQEILIKALQEKISTSKVESITHDLASIMEVIQPFVDVVSKSEENKRLPAYGTAIELMLQTIHSKLETWGCFDAWSEELNLLPALDTATAINKCESLVQAAKVSALHKAYFDLTEHDKLHLVKISLLRYNSIWLGFGGYDVKISYASEFRTTSTVYIYGRPPYHLMSSDAELIINGLLSDLVRYSRLVYGEIATGDSILKRVQQIVV